jgi:hypothetical protein
MSGPRTVTLCGRQLDKPGHICAFFDSRVEEYAVLAPFYREGLGLDEEVITVVGADRCTDHCRRLEDHGIDVAAALENGRLHVIPADDWYLKGGPFGAARMYDLVQGALAELRRNGRRARGSGVMDWALHGGADMKELMEYESRVNFLIEAYDATLLCVYDINEISGRMLMEILQTHPYVIFGRVLRENPYYRPPLERLREVLQTMSPSSSTDSLQA